MNDTPRPWLECVNLHPDVLSDDFSEDVFALDLGALSDHLIGKDLGVPTSELPRVPPVYRDAGSFFQASYVTRGLRSLLEDMLGRLAGGQGNRVLKLVTPFGGGKSHTLAALLHAARSRTALDALTEASGLPRPERVRVAVVDGQFFDAQVGKRVPNGDLTIRTLWGWVAWALGGPEGYELVRAQDEARVAPGGDTIVALLRHGPSLILLDEVLEYLVSGGGVRVEQTTLRHETLSFLKRLTVAVGNVNDAVLVYSLQSSKRESLEYTDLLRTVEHLAARKDQRREPVEGNEILSVIQRRLLSGQPNQAGSASAADAYGRVFTQMRRAYAHGEAGRQQAEEEGVALRDRIKASYPFHPTLIDLMRERWAAIPEFQRTRGALRFLATCLRAAHGAGSSRLLLGPTDVPIDISEVRLAFFKEVGQREDFQACLEHDFVGANARTRRIDDRRAREVTAEAGKRPATRLATAMLMYSFGGLRRDEHDDGDPLPPGIGETDLLGVSIGPDLDNTTIQACLKELREQCLYLHFDGVRYCFKKDPNVTLLVEQEADSVSRDAGRVRSHIRKMLGERLAGERSAIVWPTKPADVPDKEPRFLIGYLPLEFVAQPEGERRREALRIFENYGNRNREFRNGLGLAVPTADQIEPLRRSVRYLLAVKRIQGGWREHNLTKAQRSQIRERRATEETAVESALVQLYQEVWMPSSDGGALTLDVVDLGGRPLQTTLDNKRRALIHQRLTELITTVHRRVFGTVAPGKILDLFKVGEGASEPGIATDTIVAGFFSFLGFPRLLTAGALRKAIMRGVEAGLFGYATGRPDLGEDGRYRIDRSQVALERSVAEDEIDLDSGFLILPKALPIHPAEAVEIAEPQTEPEVSDGQAPQVRESTGPYVSVVPVAAEENVVSLSFTADRDALYGAWNALANLADSTGKITVTVRAEGEIDKAKLENGVLEPLRELGLIDD